MKKFVSMLAAGSVALSLTAVTLAAEVPASSDSVPAKGECSHMDDADRIQCMKERQRNLLKMKLSRAQSKMIKKTMKIEMKTGRMEERMSRRALEDAVRATWKLSRPNILKPYKPASSSMSSMSSSKSSGSSMSSAASSAATSSSASSK